MASQMESGNVELAQLRDEVANMNLYEADTHSFHDEPIGSLTVIDFPKYDMDTTKGVVKCFLDVVFDVPGPIPKGELKELLLASTPLHELPAPFGFKCDPKIPCRFDLAVVPQADSDGGSFYVVKLINFKEKVKTSVAASVCTGKPYMIDWVGEVRSMKKVIHFIFAKLGGYQWRHHVLRTREEGRPEKERSQDEWDFGFDFIENKGPRENTKNKQLRWVTIEVNKADSPVYKWPPALVEKSLRNLSNDGVLAMVHEQWPLTLYDIDNRLLRALAPLVPTLSEKALGFHGEPGAGKTPFARTIAMAISRWWLQKHRVDAAPAFRQACEFDFFRGQSGSLYRPDIFDDGTLSEQQFKKLKAFTDVGNVESMSKERWGAAKWMKGQLRIYCVNDFDAAREPADDLPVLAKRAGHPSYVTHDAFMKMLEVAWYAKENTDSNIMAVLKRTHLMVNTKTFLYVRPASEDKQPVLRIPFGDKTDFLVEESRLKYDFYRKGGSAFPNEMDLKWEESWMKAAMGGKTGEDLPQRQIIRGSSLFSAFASTSPAQSLQPDMYSSAKVGAGLAESMGASSTLFPADVLRPPTSNASPAAVVPRPCFTRSLSTVKEVIDISDSPVRPRSGAIKRDHDHVAVKEEIPEPPVHRTRLNEDIRNSQGDLLEETESVQAEADAVEEEHVEDPVEEPLEAALESLMDEADAEAEADD